MPTHGDVVGNDSEDEEFLDRAEEFEKAYNFRFEVSLALFVPSSCRRTVLQLSRHQYSQYVNNFRSGST